MPRKKNLSRKRSKKTITSNNSIPFVKAVTIDTARKDIGAQFAGRVNGKPVYRAGKTAGSSGVAFTGDELVRAKKRANRVYGVSVSKR